MRTALSGLTIRGRCFVAAGLASMVCALILGESDLLRVGLFLVALPLVAVAAVARTTYRLTCIRRLHPTRVPAGRDVRVELRLENVSRLPTGLLLVEDGLPYALGRRPRFVLERLEPRGARNLDYTARSDIRGRFRLGPLTVRLADPFGLVELVRSFSATDSLTVTPRITPLAPGRLSGDTSGSGDSHANIIAAAGEDDIATREYRHGDDLRRVHWRSTAHYGELMVRREEQYRHSRGTLLLDTRGSAHRGDGPGSSFEWAVSAAASIGVHLTRQRFDLRYLTDTGQSISREGDSSAGSIEGPLLNALAVVAPSRQRSLQDGISRLGGHGEESLLIAVLGATELEEAEFLARRSQTGPGKSATRIALLLDTASWTTLSSAGRERSDAAYAASSRALRGTGWHVLPVSRDDRLDTAWSSMAAHLGAGTTAAVSAPLTGPGGPAGPGGRAGPAGITEAGGFR